MPAFRVRRGITDFGATEDSTVEAIAPDYTAGQTFALLGSFHGASAGYAGASVVDDTRDFSAWPEFTGDAGELELHREPLGAALDITVAWELVECTAAAESPHAWEVVATGSLRMLATASSATSAVLVDPAEVDACVPFLTGSDYQGSAAPLDSNRKATLRIQSDGRVVAERVGTSGTLFVHYALVRFGSAWTVQNNVEHTFTAAGAVETEAVTAVDWSQTFVEARVRGPGDGLDEAGAVVFPGTSTQVSLQLRAGASSPTSFVGVCHLVSHPLMSVQHLDSVSGGGTEFGTSDVIGNVTISAVDTARTFLLGSNDCDGTGTAYPRQYWAFTLWSSTLVIWARARNGQPSDWATQVVELPNLDVAAPAAAVLELPSPAPATSQAQAATPSAAVLELPAPSPTSAQAQAATPPAAVLELPAPAPTSSQTQAATPAAAVLELPSPPPTSAQAQAATPAAAVLRLPAPAPSGVPGSTAAPSAVALQLPAPAPASSQAQAAAPASAVLELPVAAPATSQAQAAAPSAAVLELFAAPPTPNSTITPAAVRLVLTSPESSLDLPGLPTVDFGLAATLALAVPLPLAALSQSLPSTAALSARLTLSTLDRQLPSSSTLSAALPLAE